MADRINNDEAQVKLHAHISSLNPVIAPPNSSAMRKQIGVSLLPLFAAI
jgi:hypothetical protein